MAYGKIVGNPSPCDPLGPFCQSGYFLALDLLTKGGLAMKSVFDRSDVSEILGRIDRLAPDSRPLWGKMSVAQMLAHCSVTYELVYDNKHPKPNPVVRFLLKWFVKPMVVGEKPYPRNSRTAPVFLVTDNKDFAAEKARLTNYLNRTLALGADAFDHKESHSFGPLTKAEWNTMFAKHLDHHLRQFGV